MDHSKTQPTPLVQSSSEKLLLRKLQVARNNLTPIVNSIMSETLRDNSNLVEKFTLNMKQYEDVLHATQLMQETLLQSTPIDYPNLNVIVGNVCVGPCQKEPPVTIDEPTIHELLKLYEEMGRTIRRIVCGCDEAVCCGGEGKEASCMQRILSKLGGDDSDWDEFFGDDKKSVRKVEDSTSKSNKDTSDEAAKSPHSVFIKLQCFQSPSTSEIDQEGVEPAEAVGKPCETCKTHSAPHFHIKVGGKPIMLKLDQDTVENGMVYCINTDSDDDKLAKDIKIVIRKCQECNSTVIGSTTNIGESHESITLHGKYPETNQFEDEDVLDDKKTSSKVKMDVILDVDDVTKSTIVVSPSDEQDLKMEDHKKDEIRLTRDKICSSMEFDVSQAKTKLRTKGIEHGNAKVLIELKNLGVDKLLQASRPAKCCRKAILDERQQEALPYTVSLKSLPLLGNDVEVIEQSIDMSVRKIKNSMNLNQDATGIVTDKLAYYVNLGQDDFRPNLNFPWVVPVYEIGCPTDDCDEKDETKVEEPKEAAKSIEETKKEEREKRKLRKKRKLVKKMKKENANPIEKSQGRANLLSKFLFEDGKGEGLQKCANIILKSKSLSVLSKMRLRNNLSSSSLIILRKFEHRLQRKPENLMRNSVGNQEIQFKADKIPRFSKQLSREGLKYLLTQNKSENSSFCRIIEKRKYGQKKKKMIISVTSSSADSKEKNSFTSFEQLLDNCLLKIRKGDYKIKSDNSFRRIQSESRLSSLSEKLLKLSSTPSAQLVEQEFLKSELGKSVYKPEDFAYFHNLIEDKMSIQCPTRPLTYDTLFFSRKKKKPVQSTTSTNTVTNDLSSRGIMTNSVTVVATPTQTQQIIEEPSNTATFKDSQVSTEDEEENSPEKLKLHKETQSFQDRSSELIRIVNDYQGPFNANGSIASSKSTVISELTPNDMKYLNVLKKLRQEEFEKFKQNMERDLRNNDVATHWPPFVPSRNSLPKLVEITNDEAKEQPVMKKVVKPLSKSKMGDDSSIASDKSAKDKTKPSKSNLESSSFRSTKSNTSTLNETKDKSSKTGKKSRVKSDPPKGGNKKLLSAENSPTSSTINANKKQKDGSGNTSKCPAACKNAKKCAAAAASKKNNASADNGGASKFIQIQIEKKGDKIKSVEAKALNPCGKDICELYKNENLMGSSNGQPPNEALIEKLTQQRIELKSNENLEIFVDNKKLSIINQKKK